MAVQTFDFPLLIFPFNINNDLTVTDDSNNIDLMVTDQKVISFILNVFTVYST